MGLNIEWEKLKKVLNEIIEISLDEDSSLVKIHISDKDFMESKLGRNIIGSEASINLLLNNYIKDKSIKPKIEINREENNIFLKLENNRDAKKIQKFFQDFFFGDILKNMIEALFGAFGGMYGSENI
ncbi:MAG: hypothetical protein EU518_01985 [Promethearchaeota archaeon]|nr:MAG: hypothetical protein EU518_01985 [Candidatus Lokiarchaeota archaeon]